MKFYCGDFIYEQRTRYSKIFCYNDEGILLECYDDVNVLPFDAFREFFNIKQMINNPNLMFNYKPIDKETIEITEIPFDTQNLIIPEKIEGKQVCSITLSQNIKELKYLEIPSTFKVYPNQVFEKCTNLKSIYMHDGIEKVEKSCFAIKKNLKEIHLSNKIEEIPDYCFFECKKLENINLENIKKISQNAFCKCFNLKTCNFSDKLEFIGFRAFCNSGLEEITIPSSVNTIEKLAFQACDNLKNIINMSNVTIEKEDIIER